MSGFLPFIKARSGLFTRHIGARGVNKSLLELASSRDLFSYYFFLFLSPKSVFHRGSRARDGRGKGGIGLVVLRDHESEMEGPVSRFPWMGIIVLSF